eukprot:scaffold42204_cov74-Phaeocystis_antarctica.AAC.3
MGLLLSRTSFEPRLKPSTTFPSSLCGPTGRSCRVSGMTTAAAAVRTTRRNTAPASRATRNGLINYRVLEAVGRLPQGAEPGLGPIPAIF